MPSTRIDFGDPLTNPFGPQRQPSGAFSVDAFGLAQAQLTFAIDSTPAILGGCISIFRAGVDYPDDLGYPMKSYKVTVASSKGNISMVTVDYMGVFTSEGYTYTNMVGVVATQAQPIETHPNFTIITDSSISSNILAGDPTGTRYNSAIFNPSALSIAGGGAPQWSFGGFGVGKEGAVNIKAGVRQYLKPATTLRGTMYFNEANQAKAEKLNTAVGKTLKTGDAQTLIPDWIDGQTFGSHWLVTHAGIECIGKPTTLVETGNYAALKVTFDLMYSGKQGWDPDIYGRADEIFA
jgi:hypothetical protein